MWSALRKAISNQAEALLRWLTASVIRSTAIFVILTFVPILLLTYYIVATSIRNTKAAQSGADQQVAQFSVSLLKANFGGEREALAGAADESSLEQLLRESLQPESRSARTQRKQEQDLARAQQSARQNLSRLRARRAEFMAIALYRGDGALLAAAPEESSQVPDFTVAATDLSPPPAALVPVLTAAVLPLWFQQAQAGRSVTSAALPARAHWPRRLAFAVPVSFNPPAHRPGAAGSTGVLVGFLPTAVVGDWVNHLSAGPNRYLYVVDRDHQIVSGPVNGPFTPAIIAQLPGTARALTGHSGSGEFVSAIQLESHAITYAPLPEEQMALVLVRPVRFSFYIYRVFYDKLALIALVIFLLAVATGLLLRAAFRYYQRYSREVESGRAKTEALLGSMGDGVFAVDGEGRIIEFNRAAAALTGETAAQALHRPYTEVIQLSEEHPGQLPQHPDPVRRAMAQGRTFRLLRDLTLLRADGTRLPVTFSAAPVRDEQGGVQGCIVVFSDASQEREVDRMKNEFISIASHQLRTPMSGVKGVLALLIEEVLGPLNIEQKHYLQRAYESNERLIALVNDLLNVSRLEQGSLLLRTEAVDLPALLRTLASEFQPRAARYHQNLLLTEAASPGDSRAGLVQGDPVRLREVFANLVDNAIKYTPEGGTVRLAWSPTPDQVVVEVSDNGVGIPADKLSSLFLKFNRIQNPLSGREFGTGLGLYFARSVVELHQGRIEVASEPGQGTTFRVFLPRQPAPAADGSATPLVDATTAAPAH
ncbi:MAG: sensor histidine kinase [Acidobacteria bacterium]|nr:MAG: sensor histidine kinase [Acidobacteriota bacterium]